MLVFTTSNSLGKLRRGVNSFEKSVLFPEIIIPRCRDYWVLKCNLCVDHYEGNKHSLLKEKFKYTYSKVSEKNWMLVLLVMFSGSGFAD